MLQEEISAVTHLRLVSRDNRGIVRDLLELHGGRQSLEESQKDFWNDTDLETTPELLCQSIRPSLRTQPKKSTRRLGKSISYLQEMESTKTYNSPASQWRKLVESGTHLEDPPRDGQIRIQDARIET